jgi:hypothetical protein
VQFWEKGVTGTTLTRKAAMNFPKQNKKTSFSFVKKRSKKLLLICVQRTVPPAMDKSLLVLFSKQNCSLP